MQLAMEERDLQKMATLSQQDTLRDELNVQLENLQKVYYLFCLILILL